MAETKGGFTKKGFSKRGFTACGHFEYCDIGRNACFYDETGKDPEAKIYCNCYQRHHSEIVEKLIPSVEIKSESLFMPGEETAKVESEELEQLSLF